MPASFKIRTVPLDENNEGFEEVLDPDFGEAAIGRVAPVDSGIYLVQNKLHIRLFVGAIVIMHLLVLIEPNLSVDRTVVDHFAESLLQDYWGLRSARKS